MNDRIAISPTGAVRGAIQPPGSKSITNRALVCAALAEGTSTLTGALDSEDTQVMVESLKRLGLEVRASAENTTLEVEGCAGRIAATGADLFVGNSGTTIRFLTALVALGNGRFRLDGVARMRERPIGDLLAALATFGVEATSETNNNCPPVVVQARGIPGGKALVRGDISSQFLSGILLAAPYAASPVELEVTSELVSKPYVEMTLAVMRAFGATVTNSGLTRFTIAAPQVYRAQNYAIEPDASAASYFWATAAITSGRVTVLGLKRNALQGDVAFCDLLARMGCTVEETSEGLTVTGGALRGIEANMNAISDTVQTLAVVSLFAQGPTTITGVGHIRHKETDRIGDLARELRKLGAQVDEFPDGLRITPKPLHGAEIATYKDHRMAMSLALAGLRVPGVVILDPACTAKTYPNFFRDLAHLCGAPSPPA